MSVKSFYFVSSQCKRLRKAFDEKYDLFQYVSYQNIKMRDDEYIYGIFQFKKRKTVKSMYDFIAINLDVTQIKLSKLRRPILTHHLKLMMLRDRIPQMRDCYLSDFATYGVFELGGWHIDFFRTKLVTMDFWRSFDVEDYDMLREEQRKQFNDLNDFNNYLLEFNNDNINKISDCESLYYCLYIVLLK